MIMVEKLISRLWRRKSLRYLFVFLASIFAEFWISLFYYALSHDWVFVQGVINFFLPFISLVFTIWMIETKDFYERVRLTTASALGIAVGSTIMLLVLRALRLSVSS
jgi:phage-related protein